MRHSKHSKIAALIHKGVSVPNPDSVEIGDDVDIERISGQGVTLHTGCKIYGRDTFIHHRTIVGYEGPVAIENCQIGPDVHLRSGFFSNAVFLQNVSVGSGAHVRQGSILEEGAKIAHTVGLKHTILFPFVTLGSLINFCDCLMAGGTGPKHHSEVGSSFIHFNFTPNQDKATASLMGDVPNGVMLNQDPIFLGGQGGLVGPCHLAFGTTVAAGTICRKDEFRKGRLIFGGRNKGGNVPYSPEVIVGQKRIWVNNIDYIANLIALQRWYRNIRTLFVSDEFPMALLNGLQEKIDSGIRERIKQLNRFHQKNPGANVLSQKWSETKAYLNQATLAEKADPDENLNAFSREIEKGTRKIGKDYIAVIQGLEPKQAKKGTAWLQRIVDEIKRDCIIHTHTK